MKKLSVIIPVYNVSNYLRRCLESVTHQTYKNIEIICVNDGSTDNSLEILREYEKKDSRIIIIDKKNGGLVSARKAGLRIASSKYSTYVDSDDYLELNMYEKLMEFANEDAYIDLICSGAIREYVQDSIIHKDSFEKGIYDRSQIVKKIIPNIFSKTGFFKTNISATVWNKIYKTEKLKPIQDAVDDEIRLGEDAVITYPYIFKAKKIAITGENLYHYCIRSDSMCGEDDIKSVDRLHLMLDLMKRNCEEISNQVPDIDKMFSLFRAYYLLLKNPGCILKYDNGILYPFGRASKDEKMVVYGAGTFGVQLRNYLKKEGFNVVAWLDKSVGAEEVSHPSELSNIAYDKIIIGVIHNSVSKQIRRELETTIKDEEKIMEVDIRRILGDRDV